MTDPLIQDKLDYLFDRTPVEEINHQSKIVVFSDLHMGNGGGNDDFMRNSDLFSTVLRSNFADRGYTVVLNGDVEELYRFRLRHIMNKWKDVYGLYADLRKENRLIKIAGNHDYELYALPPHSYPFRLVPAVRYRYDGNDIFVFHGHQATSYFERWHAVGAFFLRYGANPLNIKNRTVAHDSAKKIKTELRIYEFSTRRKIITLIGHTHRPLFESHSKIDELKFKIENRLRSYEAAEAAERRDIEEEVGIYKRQLLHLYDDHDETSLQSGLYNQLLVPSLFNSGCVIGKRGITALEIAGGRMSLLHWFDRGVSAHHLSDGEREPERVEGTDYFGTVIKSETLAYIFARIKLLA